MDFLPLPKLTNRTYNGARGTICIKKFSVMDMYRWMRFAYEVVSYSYSRNFTTRTGFCEPRGIVVCRATWKLELITSVVWSKSVMGSFFDTSIMSTRIKWFGTTLLSFGKIIFNYGSIKCVTSRTGTDREYTTPVGILDSTESVSNSLSWQGFLLQI